MYPYSIIVNIIIPLYLVIGFEIAIIGLWVVIGDILILLRKMRKRRSKYRLIGKLVGIFFITMIFWPALLYENIKDPYTSQRLYESRKEKL